MASSPRYPLFEWAELPRFATFCREVCAQLGLEYEDQFDLIRWAISETLCWDPIGPTLADPRFNDDVWRFFRTHAAPALTDLPPLVVTFKIDNYPQFGQRGLIVGREVWTEADLRRIGFELQDSPGL